MIAPYFDSDGITLYHGDCLKILPQLEQYDIYSIGISGGKDSQALLLWAKYESGFPVEKIRAIFCDTGNEHQFTYDHIRMMSETILPIETIYPPLGFYELARKRQRFPSTKARFCTQELKIFPTQRHILEYQRQGLKVLILSGVRAGESKERSELPAFDFDGYYFADMYRPLLNWSLDDVWKFLEKYNSPRNPLYDYGSTRVGCFPCVMSNKHEIRQIAKYFPDRIDRIRQLESEIGKQGTSFFPPSKIPKRFRNKSVTKKKTGESVSIATIDDVVEWSKTGHRRPNQYEFDLEEFAVCLSNIGMCE